MENASKALLIAGGILLAMLTASLLVLLNNNIQTIENAKSEKIAQEQLVAFNMEYEAYNKKIMYGTDVITVINKAIDNNIIMNNVAEPTNAYYVNVVFKINKTFQTDVQKYDLEDKLISSTLDASSTLNSGTYKLGIISGTDMKLDENIVEFFNNTTQTTVVEDIISSGAKTGTKITYPALALFKKEIFTCTGIKYDNRSGRVNEISFEQVKEKP